MVCLTVSGVHNYVHKFSLSSCGIGFVVIDSHRSVMVA
jgi:hypothetical protein